MALRMQKERQDAGLFPSLREYSRLYGLTRERVARAKFGALVMHPGPMNEGVEIAPDVAYGPQSVIEEQVTNGVAVRMALPLSPGRRSAVDASSSPTRPEVLSVRRPAYRARACAPLLHPGGRVIDPAPRRWTASADVLVRDGLIAEVGRRRAAERARRAPARSTPRAGRRARRSSTCTPTCASPASSTRRRSRPARGRRRAGRLHHRLLHAEHRAGARHGGGRRVRAAQRAGHRRRARLPHRRDHARARRAGS